VTTFRPADIDLKWTKAILSPVPLRRLSSLCKKDFVAVYLRRLDSLRRGFHHLFILKSAVERGSLDQTMDEMDIVDPVDFTRKGIDFLVHFVHKVHDIQRIARRIRS